LPGFDNPAGIQRIHIQELDRDLNHTHRGWGREVSYFPRFPCACGNNCGALGVEETDAIEQRSSFAQGNVKESAMRKIISVAAVASMLCLVVPGSFAKVAPAAKSGSGTIVIVFKDGHRQSFNLADIARVEFPGSGDAASSTGATGTVLPTREHFLGKWEVGDGTGNYFFITLREDGDAQRSMGDVHGKWVYVDGEARVTWDDGAQDAIRKVGSKHEKFAYKAGRSFTDTPDNVTGARNTTPHSI
jgi:hypothetical protein